jgi:hypothetical protein
MTTAILCSRGRGCEHVEMREPPLARRVVELLQRARGAKLPLRGIAERLRLECSHEGEGWQNVCRLAHELAKLAEFHLISSDGKDAHWIEPPRVAPATGERINPITGARA